MPGISPTLTVPSFVDQLLQHAGTTSTTQVALDKDTDIQLKKIDAIFKTKKDDVVNSLLSRAMLVHPELHRNLKKANA
jgi:V-type H+-transporting ATPase subunit G